MGDSRLLDWDDPVIRVEEFILNVERDVNRSRCETKTEEEALYKYFCSLQRKVTSKGSISSDSDLDCNSWEDDSKVGSVLEDESVGDSVAEDANVERLSFERRVSSGCFSEVNPVSASAVDKRAGWEDRKELPCYLYAEEVEAERLHAT